jgi:hypothetical protein
MAPRPIPGGVRKGNEPRFWLGKAVGIGIRRPLHANDPSQAVAIAETRRSSDSTYARSPGRDLGPGRVAERADRPPGRHYGHSRHESGARVGSRVTRQAGARVPTERPACALPACACQSMGERRSIVEDRRTAHQPIALLLNHAIAFARAPDHTRSTEYRDVAVVIVNQSS